jgi:hypothetical protein
MELVIETGRATISFNMYSQASICTRYVCLWSVLYGVWLLHKTPLPHCGNLPGVFSLRKIYLQMPGLSFNSQNWMKGAKKQEILMLDGENPGFSGRFSLKPILHYIAKSC